MEILNLFGNKCISYGNLLLCSDTEEKVINFYNESIEMDKKYEKDLKYIKYNNLMAFYNKKYLGDLT